MESGADRIPLTRLFKVDEVGDGASGEISASKAEMEAVARLLHLVALSSLTFTYRLHQAGGGRLRLTGQLHADVTQTCVISLDPVETHLDVPVEAAFWPAPLVEVLERSAEEPGSHELLDWPEAIVDGRIDLGPLIYETLATALEPYPKREGASFDWSQDKADEEKSPERGPFAALAALKRP